jgi:membrane-bound inhibitor of C-type lysozyme
MARFAKRFACTNAAAMLAFACTNAAAVLAFAGPAAATEAHYTCSGGDRLAAEFSPPDAARGEVKLTFQHGGRELTLPQVMAADGGRYAGAGIEFWIKGRSATLTMKGVKETCATQ